MRPHAKISGFRSRSKPRGGLRTEASAGGFALLIVMMLAVVLLISLTAALPSVYTEGQREKEEELIFRGNQYARAIALFRRQFQRYPTSVKELLQTNSMRFLRHEYPDPMSKDRKWRFIHADANGTPLDSLTFAKPTAPKPLVGGSSGSDQTAGAPAAGTEQKSSGKSAFFGDNKEMQGAFIVGVASTSKRKSIRVLNNKTHYNEWEFLGVELNSSAGVPALGAQPQGPVQPSTPPSAFPTGRPGGMPGFPPTPPLIDQSPP
ncbi:MAG: type II secretion system GspH family protein [Acidobacteriia bacterium]|nr:type II secretion system GspH family protein [Terriglobia bacterium]